MRAIGTMLGFAAVALLLRSTALSVLAGRGIVVDVLAFAVTVWALRRGELGGTLFGFALGLVADLDAAHWLGRHALALSLIGYSVGRTSHTLVRDQSRTVIVMLFVATLVHQIWTLAFEVGGASGWPYLLRHTLLAAIVTAPLGALVLAIVVRVAGRPLFANATASTGY